MLGESSKRNLTAIESGDRAGYSRLMSEDETETVNRLMDCECRCSWIDDKMNGKITRILFLRCGLLRPMCMSLSCAHRPKKNRKPSGNPVITGLLK
jgi:hypothetical protein